MGGGGGKRYVWLDGVEGRVSSCPYNMVLIQFGFQYLGKIRCSPYGSGNKVSVGEGVE